MIFLHLRQKIAGITTLAIMVLAFPAASHAAALDSIPFDTLPQYSSAPLSPGREPITFAYVGSEANITHLFASHGWYGADRISPLSLYRAYRAAKADGLYPTAPFSPAFIGHELPELTFQQPTETNSIAQRHHTRIWDTDSVTTDGRQVWVGTASLDVSIAQVGRTYLPLHLIDPNLPAEREFILSSLQITDAQYYQLLPAQDGINSSGQNNYTDGQVAVIDADELASPTPPAPTATPVPAVTPAPAAQPATASFQLFVQTAAHTFKLYWQ